MDRLRNSVARQATAFARQPLRSDPLIRELLFGVFGSIARFESECRSQRIKAGLARRKAQGKPVGGRVPGAKDK